ncbi:hypothetical protein L484_004277 [Morus notabilis]|uniref:Uncharacterized protein n=1 Tax=Morus notabilis TaxID=981085 RepID=W9RDX1_9ROSA|nr:hypothetical protein L484_004277 [Morus notabilis]
MQKLHELAQTQLFELRAQSEEERAAKQSEVNLLMDEVERAQTRLLSLEREKGLLRTQLQSANEETDEKRFSNLRDQSDGISLDGVVIGFSRKFRYLGSIVQFEGDIDEDIGLDIGLSECWAIKRQQIYKMSVAEMCMLRWMSGHTRMDRIRNEVIRSKIGVAPIEDKVLENRLRCDDIDSNTILENSLIAKEKIISELNMELHNIETTLSSEREEHINEIKKLNSLLHEKEIALEEMKKELQARPTEKLVDDLRKKVKILQAVGYNSIEAEDWEVATSGEEMSKMESLLLDKNRKMEHELTQMKVKLSEKASLLETAEGKIAELTAKVNEQQKLIQKLEDDILKVWFNSMAFESSQFPE